MPYSNGWKIANGSKIQIGATTYEDAVEIGIPSSVVELIDITTLGSSRKEWVASDFVDSGEISVTLPSTGTNLTVGGAAASCVITLSKLTKTLTFSAIIVADEPTPAGLDGKLGRVVRLKPTTAVTVT